MHKDRYDRQSFLGEKSQDVFGPCLIGIVGLGGGGSHIVQQVAHIGFLNYVLYDNDIVEDSNLNRLVGGTFRDAQNKKPKIDVAKRYIRRLHPKANIKAYKMRWQDNPLPLRNCDIIIGCVDGFAERRELEVCARRYLIPYIDIGIDVHQIEPQPPTMNGQIILSMPGEPCMTCIGFFTEEKLAQEAAKYGAAGHKPQVVWANGIVASVAVGIVIDLLTDWTKSLRKIVYLSYMGNQGIIQPHVRLEYLKTDKSCIHYPSEQIGDPLFKHL